MTEHNTDLDTDAADPAATIKPDAQARLNAVPVTDDVVAYMLGCWLALAPRTSQAIVQAVERQVRDTFGGDEVWVSKGMAEQRKQRDEQIKRDYIAGERIELLMRRYELSKRRLFQIVRS